MTTIIALASLCLCAVYVSGQIAPTPAMRPTTRPANAPVVKAPNPHWNTTDCVACHQLKPGGVESIPLDKVNGICWRCHDGTHAHQEVHPVARKFAGPGLKKPAGWPTPNDELSCVTCHNFGPGHATGGPRPKSNPWMLRGYTGGSLEAFCAKCHVSSPAHKPFNPHAMLADNGQPNLRSCLICHKETDDLLHRKTRTGNSDLLTSVIPLCIRCHTRHVEFSKHGHIGIHVPPGIKAYMLAREDVGLAAKVTPEEIASHEGLNRQPQWLPLGQGDTVVCSTCHNPHQAGLFPPDSVLSYGGMKLDEPNRPTDLRGLGKEICRGCHNK